MSCSLAEISTSAHSPATVMILSGGAAPVTAKNRTKETPDTSSCLLTVSEVREMRALTNCSSQYTTGSLLPGFLNFHLIQNSTSP